MPHALILSACRTAIGRFRGGLSSLPATDLGAIVLREAVAQANLSPTEVDEVILGNVLTGGTGQAPARQAALRAGLPPTVAALTINKVCGSGLKSVMLAAQAVRCGDAELIVAGGMESMSRAGLVLPRESPALGDRNLTDTLMHDGLTCAFSNLSMGVIAEQLAEQDGITRDEQDRFALQSHRRAVAAIESGAFAAEIVPVRIRKGSDESQFVRDECPRSDTSLERLAKLSSAFRKNGSVTAGNSSAISDGAAAVVVASEAIAARLTKRPLARILAMATSGGEPQDLFIAPVEAIRRAVAASGHSMGDIDLFEINEAFAVQVLACVRRLGLSLDRVNADGGAIALGHPIGGSGARVLVTLLHAMQRRDCRLGVAALCLGGGNAVAMVVESTNQ
ncbi:MAG TPA: acetyl-CoA C-acyltransferase [Planctomycetaceae bacterium]|nr:acetyl-CoA C-acyltransferase [Planctomycetaceae bacterium]